MAIRLRDHIDLERWRRALRTVGPAAGLLGLMLAVYLRVIGFELIFGWDDELYLLKRIEAVSWFEATWRQRLLTPQLGYPVPLPTFLYYLVWHLPEGGRLPVFHGLNLLAHLGALWAVVSLGRRWTNSRVAGWFAGALWATHPLLVETVAWVTNLKTAMLGAASLGAIALWEAHLASPSRWRSAGSLGCGLVAFGCRPEAVVLGPTLALLAWMKPGRRLRDPAIFVTPALLSALATAYLPVAVTGQFQALERGNPEGALQVGFGARIRRVFAGLGLQLRHVVWPVDLAPIYDARESVRSGDLWIGVAAGVALVATTLRAWWRERPARRAWVVWWAFWLPASGLVFLPRFTADTYMYVPLFGLVSAVVSTVAEVASGASRRLRRAVVLAGALIIAATTLLSIDYVGRWRNAETLMAPLTEEPRAEEKAASVLVHHYAEFGKWDEARAVLDRRVQAMFADGQMSVDCLKTYVRTGSPELAVEWGLQMLGERYTGLPTDYVAPFVVWTAVNSEVDLRGHPELRALFRGAARRAVPFFRRQGTAERLIRKVDYLREQNWPGLAARYAVEALRKAPERCDLWALVAASPDVEPPARVERPARCD